jgi:hypothetical protein
MPPARVDRCAFGDLQPFRNNHRVAAMVLPAVAGSRLIVQCERYCLSELRWENEEAMKPADDSRMANEKAAINLQRKKPSWRGTKAVNGAPAKRMIPDSEHMPWLVVAGLIALLFLIGWLLHVR